MVIFISDFIKKMTDKTKRAHSESVQQSDSDDDYMNMDLGVLEAQYQKQKKEEEKKKGPLPYSKRRMLEIAAQKERGLNRPINEVAKETLEESQKAAIPTSNIGFKLLEKMGFKPGTGLGKNKDGIQEPIEIKFREGKKGVGVESAIKEKAEKYWQEYEKLEKVQKDSFEVISRRRIREQKSASDLYKSRVVCEQLDLKKGILENPLWTPFNLVAAQKRAVLLNDLDLKPNVKAELSEVDIENVKCEENLAKITAYLREKYNYCLWCGEAYSSPTELADLCPGDTEEDH